MDSNSLPRRPRQSALSAASLRAALLVVSAAFAPVALAQTENDTGLWFAFVSQGRFVHEDSFQGRLRWWLDVHSRQGTDGERFELGIIRPAIGYALSDRVTAHIGYAYIPTDPRGRDSFIEQRIWQQVVWNLPTEGFTLQSRTRLEQRFTETGGETGWRLRQFFKATVPLTEDHRWYVSAWDEGFVDLGDTRWGQREGFRQNRAFLGLGRITDLAPSSALEVGYMNQWLDLPALDRYNHILSITYSMSF